MTDKIVIAIAGSGDIAKYAVDELLNHGGIRVIVLSRDKKEWFDKRSPDVTVHTTDYSVSSILNILNSTAAVALFSLIHSFDEAVYKGTHRAMLEACQASNTCKRYSPSYYGGNIDAFPGYPRVYKDVHQAYHDELVKTAGGIEWTVVNIALIMDYIINFKDDEEYEDKSYIRSIRSILPIDLKEWSAVIPGTGNEPAGFTSARDVGKAIAALATTTEKWDQHTYIYGEQITWNVLLKKLEKHNGRKFNEGENLKYISLKEIQQQLDAPAEDESATLGVMMNLEWTALGAQGLPVDIVEGQRAKFFGGVHFRTVDEFLEDSKTMTVV
ncbi:Oxidoreductase swnR [Cladobotryum mycophilum]|uniref:Oxidoreductase swnR n=1 Tax=Cladobotryum mycophilum TaxID=491253 RepID=A0ABR0SIW8_9HYPO